MPEFGSLETCDLVPPDDDIGNRVVDSGHWVAISGREDCVSMSGFIVADSKQTGQSPAGAFLGILSPQWEQMIVTDSMRFNSIPVNSEETDTRDHL